MHARFRVAGRRGLRQMIDDLRDLFFSPNFARVRIEGLDLFDRAKADVLVAGVGGARCWRCRRHRSEGASMTHICQEALGTEPGLRWPASKAPTMEPGCRVEKPTITLQLRPGSCDPPAVPRRAERLADRPPRERDDRRGSRPWMRPPPETQGRLPRAGASRARMAAPHTSRARPLFDQECSCGSHIMSHQVDHDQRHRIAASPRGQATSLRIPPLP